MLFEMTPYEKNYRNIFGRNPFADFDKEFFGENVPSMRNFQTDIQDTGDAYVLEADLPLLALVAYGETASVHHQEEGSVVRIIAVRSIDVHQEIQFLRASYYPEPVLCSRRDPVRTL